MWTMSLRVDTVKLQCQFHVRLHVKNHLFPLRNSSPSLATSCGNDIGLTSGTSFLDVIENYETNDTDVEVCIMLIFSLVKPLLWSFVLLNKI